MINRRNFNHWLLSLPILPVSLQAALTSKQKTVFSKEIRSSGESIPAIGMGTWITFDKNPKSASLQTYVNILDAFFAAGGKMVDSSPMYGFAQQLLGAVLSAVDNKDSLFAATKVWVPGKQLGLEQMEQSIKSWGLKTMDLMYVHNMLDWQTHLPTLNQWKTEGKIRYTGITTSHGRRHQDLIALLKKHPVDFVQFTYNINDREAENYLLPLAQDQGVAVVINRPFQTGGLFTRVKSQPLPVWAEEIQCKTWSQFFLKFVISHPSVTCAIPATSQKVHMLENMQALKGQLPDEHMRREMHAYFDRII